MIFIRRGVKCSHRAQRMATSSNDRTPPCRGVRCEFESRRSRQFRRCTLGWFGECSFKALIRGFDSCHRRQFHSPFISRLRGRILDLATRCRNFNGPPLDILTRFGVSYICNDEPSQSRIHTSHRATAAGCSYVIAQGILNLDSIYPLSQLARGFLVLWR